MTYHPRTEGELVIYGGSLTDHHGTYQAWTCPCRRAHAAENPRWLLTDPDGGHDQLWHVKPSSINAIPSQETPPVRVRADDLKPGQLAVIDGRPQTVTGVHLLKSWRSVAIDTAEGGRRSPYTLPEEQLVGLAADV